MEELTHRNHLRSVCDHSSQGSEQQIVNHHLWPGLTLFAPVTTWQPSERSVSKAWWERFSWPSACTGTGNVSTGAEQPDSVSMQRSRHLCCAVQLILNHAALGSDNHTHFYIGYKRSHLWHLQCPPLSLLWPSCQHSGQANSLKYGIGAFKHAL